MPSDPVVRRLVSIGRAPQLVVEHAPRGRRPRSPTAPEPSPTGTLRKSASAGCPLPQPAVPRCDARSRATPPQWLTARLRSRSSARRRCRPLAEVGQLGLVLVRRVDCASRCLALLDCSAVTAIAIGASAMRRRNSHRPDIDGHADARAEWKERPPPHRAALRRRRRSRASAARASSAAAPSPCGTGAGTRGRHRSDRRRRPCRRGAQAPRRGRSCRSGSRSERATDGFGDLDPFDVRAVGGLQIGDGDRHRRRRRCDSAAPRGAGRRARARGARPAEVTDPVGGSCTDAPASGPHTTTTCTPAVGWRGGGVEVAARDQRAVDDVELADRLGGAERDPVDAERPGMEARPSSSSSTRDDTGVASSASTKTSCTCSC